MELVIKHGPQFTRDSLHKVAGADSYVTLCRTLSEPTKRLSLYSTLRHAWESGELRELRELPDDSGLIIVKETLDSPRKLYHRTITSHLRDACANKIGCKPDEIMSCLWRGFRLPEHRLAWLRRPDQASWALGLGSKIWVLESDKD